MWTVICRFNGDGHYEEPWEDWHFQSSDGNRALCSISTPSRDLAQIRVHEDKRGAEKYAQELGRRFSNSFDHRPYKLRDEELLIFMEGQFR